MVEELEWMSDGMDSVGEGVCECGGEGLVVGGGWDWG